MSHPRYDWWGYVKAVVRRYPQMYREYRNLHSQSMTMDYSGMPHAADNDLACIQSVKIKPNKYGCEREIKLYDKKVCLELLGKHLGMFKDKVEIDIKPSR